MKPNLLLVCTALATGLSLVPSAQAQAGVYAVFTATRMGNLQSSPFAAYTNANGGTKATIDVSGGTFGGFYEFKTVGPLRLGADVRGNVESSTRGASVTSVGTGSHLYSVLGGVRARTSKTYFHVDPYVQLSAGLGRSDFGLATNTSSANFPYNPDYGAAQLHNGVEYHVFAGADIKLLPVLDFRVVELGYGGLESGSHNYPLRSVSTGFVFHLPTP